jgi:hypothetical protein
MWSDIRRQEEGPALTVVAGHLFDEECSFQRLPKEILTLIVLCQQGMHVTRYHCCNIRGRERNAEEDKGAW